MRESVHEKGRRYLGEGRLIVSVVTGGRVEATCRGGEDVYEVGLRDNEWFCTCPARSRCAHLVALQLVTVRTSSVPGQASAASSSSS